MKGRQNTESLTKSLIDYFMRKGLTVQYAKYTGYEKPFVIKRHAPDVIAVDEKTGLGYIGEVKLCSELGDQITKEQFEDFGKMLMKSEQTQKTPLPFYIAVPQDCESKIKETFRLRDIPWRENIQVVGF